MHIAFLFPLFPSHTSVKQGDDNSVSYKWTATRFHFYLSFLVLSGLDCSADNLQIKGNALAGSFELVLVLPLTSLGPDAK